MKKLFSIKRILAVTLLVVFTIGATPKMLLHDIFSNHIDYCSSTAVHDGKAQLNIYKFNCGFVDVAGITPFIVSAAPEFYFPAAYSDVRPQVVITTPATPTFDYYNHRGPPATC